MGANIFIMAPHLIVQWKNEVIKFVKDNEVEVISYREYNSKSKNQINNRTIVLCSVEEVMNSLHYHYDFKKLYEGTPEIGLRRVHGSSSAYDKDIVQKSRRLACHISGGYTGTTITTTIIIVVTVIIIIIIRSCLAVKTSYDR